MADRWGPAALVHRSPWPALAHATDAASFGAARNVADRTLDSGFRRLHLRSLRGRRKGSRCLSRCAAPRLEWCSQRGDGVEEDQKRRHVGFIRALIAHVVASGADAQRVYVIGFSLGGQMAIRLIHEVPELLAGAAIIGSTQPTPDNLNIDHDAHGRLPVVTMHGTADPLARFDGGPVSIHGHLPRGQHFSASATAAYFAERNGISTEPAPTRLPNLRDFGTPGRVIRYDYSADGAAPVRFYAIEGGGHVIPNPYRTPIDTLRGGRPPRLCAGCDESSVKEPYSAKSTPAQQISAPIGGLRASLSQFTRMAPTGGPARAQQTPRRPWPSQSLRPRHATRKFPAPAAFRPGCLR